MYCIVQATPVAVERLTAAGDTEKYARPCGLTLTAPVWYMSSRCRNLFSHPEDTVCEPPCHGHTRDLLPAYPTDRRYVLLPVPRVSLIDQGGEAPLITPSLGTVQRRQAHSLTSMRQLFLWRWGAIVLHNVLSIVTGLRRCNAGHVGQSQRQTPRPQYC
jgi:hypothetical protein